MGLLGKKVSAYMRGLLGKRTRAGAAILVVLLLASSLTACTLFGSSGSTEIAGVAQPDIGEEENTSSGEQEEEEEEEETSVLFEVQGWEVISNIDRVYLKVEFSCNMRLSLALADSRGVKTSYSRWVTAEESFIELPMTYSSLETPKAGMYSIIVKDESGKVIATVEVADFEGPDLTVTGVSYAGEENTIRVDVCNEGDLPAYVTYANVCLNDVHPQTEGGQSSVFPGEATEMLVSWTSGGGLPSASVIDLEIELTDSLGGVIAYYKGYTSLAPMETYASGNWGYAISYPIGWTVTEESTSLESLLTIMSPDGEGWVTIEIERNPGSRLDQWVDQNNLTRQAEWYSYELLTSEQLNWRGLSAYQLTWVRQVEILSDITQGKEICFDDDGWKYSVRGVALESVFSVYAAQLEAILNMFALLH